MINLKIEKGLNKQVILEGESSMEYLAMASWAENEGLEGVAEFLYAHSDEEREHMLKLIKYINERNGTAIIPAFSKPNAKYKDLNSLFQQIFDHEVSVSQSINNLVEIALEEKDYSTHNFLQWYVAEQIEEERLTQLILDKLALIGNDKGGLYLFDRDIRQFHNESRH